MQGRVQSKKSDPEVTRLQLGFPVIKLLCHRLVTKTWLIDVNADELGMESFGDSSSPAPWHGEKVCCGTSRGGAGVLRREGVTLLRCFGGGVARC